MDIKTISLLYVAVLVVCISGQETSSDGWYSSWGPYPTDYISGSDSWGPFPTDFISGSDSWGPYPTDFISGSDSWGPYPTDFISGSDSWGPWFSSSSDYSNGHTTPSSSGGGSCPYPSPFSHIAMNSTPICNEMSCDIGPVKIWRTVMYDGEHPQYMAKCGFTVPENGDLVFDIEWFENNVSIGSSYGLPSYVVYDQCERVDDLDLAASYHCAVTVYNATSRRMLAHQQSEPIAPAEPISTDVYVTRGHSVPIGLLFRYPPLCNADQDCHVEVKMYDVSDSSDCSDSVVGFFDGHTCGGRLEGLSFWSSDDPEGNLIFEHYFNLSVALSPTLQLKDTYTLKVVLESFGATTNMHAELPPITVHVEDDETWQKAFCIVNPGFKVKTFDGLMLKNGGPGEYLVYNQTSGTSVSALVERRVNDSVTRTCGAIIQAGKDIYSINHCNGSHFVGYLTRNDSILSVRQKNDKIISTRLPYGTKADVVYFPHNREISITIIPTPFDVGEVYGLCGDLDGVKLNDNKGRDGSTTPFSGDDNYDAGTDGAGLFNGWKISPAESKLNLANALSLPAWDRAENTFCTCQASNNYEPTCVLTEAQLCPNSLEGTEVSTNVDINRWNRTETMASGFGWSLDLPETPPISTTTEDVASSTLEAQVNSSYALASLSTSPISEDLHIFLFQFTLVENYMIDEGSSWVTEIMLLSQYLSMLIADVDIDYQTNHPSDYSQVQSQTCLGNCNGQGTCNSETGVCTCNANYGYDDCTLSLAVPPVLVIVESAEQTPATFDNCINIGTSGSTSSSTCRIRTYSFTTVGLISDGQMIVSAIFININEVQCCIPSRRRRRRSVSDPSLGEQVSVAVSNDGVNFSEETSVTVLDSTCVTVNTTSNVAVLQSGYCLISGTCYTNGTIHDDDSCNSCIIEEDLYSWTRDSQTSSCQTPAESPSSDDTTAIAVGVTVPLAIIAIAAVAVLGVMWYKAKNRGKVGSPDISLYDTSVTPSKSKFVLRKEDSMLHSDSPVPQFPPRSQIGPSLSYGNISGTPRDAPQLNMSEGVAQNAGTNGPSLPGTVHVPQTGNQLPMSGDASKPAVYVEPRQNNTTVLTINEAV